MWVYEKKLEYPVKIKNPNPELAKLIITQYGGADGELGASLRYLSQRFTMPCSQAKGTLNDIGTEELAHLEIIGSICYQLLKDSSEKQLVEQYAPNFVEHGLGVYPQSAAGVPFNAAYFQCKGDPIVDLTEDLAAEQKARKTYEYLIQMCDDPDVLDPLRFLREREIVHYQRFGEAKRKLTSKQKAHSLCCFAAPLKYKSYDIEP